MKIIKSNNIALVEHAPTDEVPEYDFDSETGILFVFGYNLSMGDVNVGSAVRSDTTLIGYKILTGSAFTAAYDALCRLAKEAEVNLENCVAFYTINKLEKTV